MYTYAVSYLESLRIPRGCFRWREDVASRQDNGITIPRVLMRDCNVVLRFPRSADKESETEKEREREREREREKGRAKDCWSDELERRGW